MNKMTEIELCEKALRWFNEVLEETAAQQIIVEAYMRAHAINKNQIEWGY